MEILKWLLFYFICICLGLVIGLTGAAITNAPEPAKPTPITTVPTT